MKFPQRDTVNHSNCNAAISKKNNNNNKIKFSLVELKMVVL